MPCVVRSVLRSGINPGVGAVLMLIAVLALLAVIRFVNLELQFVTTCENKEEYRFP